jgi:hypothetical protein
METDMRTFFLLCTVALAVAIGMGFFVGLFVLDTAHSDGRYVVTLTVNTNMIARNMPESSTTHHSDSADNDLVDMKGKITAVRPEKNEFVMSENIKSWVFQLAKNGQVFINDRPGVMADMKVGDDATVTFERQGQQLIASAVRCTRK